MIPVLNAYDGVELSGLRPAGFRILAAFDGATKVLGHDLWISCGREGHPQTDPHTLGEALDLSVNGLMTAEILRLKSYLEQTLGERFTVLFEAPSVPTVQELAAIAYVNGQATGMHLHVQRKKDTVYPPPASETRA